MEPCVLPEGVFSSSVTEEVVSDTGRLFDPRLNRVMAASVALTVLRSVNHRYPNTNRIPKAIIIPKSYIQYFKLTEHILKKIFENSRAIDIYGSNHMTG